MEISSSVIKSNSFDTLKLRFIEKGHNYVEVMNTNLSNILFHMQDIRTDSLISLLIKSLVQ